MTVCMDDLAIEDLFNRAKGVSARMACSEDLTAGGVGAALLTQSGAVFTGLCIDTACSLGFCAEHAAIADMLKHRETRIAAIVAVGDIMAPCGRCRELIRQVDPGNWHTKVVVAKDSTVTLAELLPFGTASNPPDR